MTTSILDDYTVQWYLDFSVGREGEEFVRWLLGECWLDIDANRVIMCYH